MNRNIDVKEEGTAYEIFRENKEDIYNIMIRDILNDKIRIINIINKYLKPMYLLEEANLNKCSNLFLRRKYNYNEKIINTLYINKKSLIFFLILYLDEIDINFPYKLLNYCIDIMQEWNKKYNGRKNRYPGIAPIVIYVGKDKWNIKNFKDSPINVTTFDKYRLNLEYNLIDVKQIMIKTKSDMQYLEDFVYLESLK